MTALAASAGSLAVSLLFLIAAGPLFEAERMVRTNYAGRRIPTAAGVVFVPAFILSYVVLTAVDGAASKTLPGPAESLLILVVGMCFFGLLDDVAAEGSDRGFSGHLKALFRGRLTTGLLKAAGGLLVAVAASLFLAGPAWEVILDAVLIALAANLFNLLDTRPGRALKVFVVLFATVTVLNRGLMDTFMPYLASAGAIALSLFYGDLSERFMMGDAGSNVLGATIGLGLVIAVNDWWKLGIAIALLLVNLTSERFSFSVIIENNRVLCWVDSLGRRETASGG